jgi:nucleotide-binding universal stress UspA family protein
MATVLKPEWSRPGTILFAAEIPINEKAFSHALAQAVEHNATLILFHAGELHFAAAPSLGGLDGGFGGELEYIDPTAMERAETRALDPLARRARAAGVHCRVLVRPGPAADGILQTAREKSADRIVMGTHAPGPIGKLLIGSVAESVLRRSPVPVCVVGPQAMGHSAESGASHSVLCAVSRMETGGLVTAFAAEVATRSHAGLIVQHVIRPQDCAGPLMEECFGEIESKLMALVPTRLRQKVHPEPFVVPGEPSEEVLYLSRKRHTDLIVMGAHGASAFAAIARQGVVYKVMAHASCPVMTLSPAVLETGSSKPAVSEPAESYMAGIV